MPTISIIVPVYKVEEYLPACIRSILRQTYRDFELILVDDGSPDRCGEICDEFAKLDSRIRAVHQKNGGVSKARNTGIDHATGEWVTCIDPDDMITPRYLESFFKDNFSSCELLIQGLSLFVHGRVTKKQYKMPDFSLPIENAYSLKLIQNCFAVCKAYKRSIIQLHNINFPENRTYGEDCIFFYKYLFYVSRVFSSSSCRYLYRRDNPSSAAYRPHDPITHFSFMMEANSLIKQLNQKFKKHISYIGDYELMQIQTIIYNTSIEKYSYRKFVKLIYLLRDRKRFDIFEHKTAKLSISFFCLAVYYTPTFILYYIMVPIWIMYINLKKSSTRHQME